MFEENITREYSPLDLNTPIGTNVRPWFSIMPIAYIQQEAIKKLRKILFKAEQARQNRFFDSKLRKRALPTISNFWVKG